MASGTLSQVTDKQMLIFKKYIGDRKILIADPQVTSRTSMARVLIDLGARTENIALVTSYEEGVAFIEKKSPNVIISDYNLGNRGGLDLLQKMRDMENIDPKQSLFILVTGNNSQSAVAQAAEEEVDTYILKPFTPSQLRLQIMRAAIQKLMPSDYMEAIQRGKTLLFEGKISEAKAAFFDATKLDPKPSLAWGYHGQAEAMEQLLEEARGSYGSGLKYNKIHYKCLVGLFETLMTQNQHQEAYDIVKKIAQYFPANPKRLTSVLRLAVVTQSYDDIEKYYHLYTQIDDRSAELTNYMVAALVICGKFYMKKQMIARAADLYERAIITSQGKPKVIKEIVMSLVGQGNEHFSQKFLSRFPSGAQSSTDYLALKLAVRDITQPKGVTINEGKNLILKDHHDPIIYEIVIKRELESGHKDEAEHYAQQAANRWTDQKEHFLSLTQDLKSAS